jgi:transcriptional regulator
VYVPHFNSVEDETQIRAFVESARVAQFVTVNADGTPVATLVPVLWDGSRVLAHLAKANPQWRSIGPHTTGLMIVSGPDAYISPAWYPAKAEHGRVVPTWNYSAVHLTGPVTVHIDPAWLLGLVSRLTDWHESGRSDPWSVADAPERYRDGQLRAIVGIELTVHSVEAKAKMSQNRSDADREGAIAGLRADAAVAAVGKVDGVADAVGRAADSAVADAMAAGALIADPPRRPT